MSAPDPTFSIQVDLTNPGQFFACCGLLELAYRLSHNARGWFEGATFKIADAPANFVAQFLACDARSIIADSKDNSSKDDSDKGDDKTVPIQLATPFALRLDWWITESAQQAKLKTWSAGQKITDVLGEMRKHFKNAIAKNPHDWLRVAEPIKSPKPFGYDSRLSRTAALDMGHNDMSYVTAFSPAVDVLTVVGLQRFRPWVIETWTRNRYCTWSQPLPADIAAVSTLGLIPQFIDSCFEFPIKPRDSQGRYKLFGHAQPARRPQ